MKMLKAFRYIVLTVIGTVLLSSCDPSLLDHEWNPESSRKLTIRLTDAPVEAEEVNVDIQKIIIKTDDGFSEVELATAAGVYNLLDYQNGADTLIGDVIIDFDDIKEIRLILGENNSIKINGELFPLTVPSGSESGLKIKVNIDVTNDQLVEILIDFDASKSVVDLGNGNYVLNPVITVASIIADGQEEEQDYIGNADCVHGKGYWKTHSEEGPAALDSAWLLLPDSSRTELFTTEKTYLSFLEQSSGGDDFVKLAQQYIIAELNVLAGVEIAEDVAEAWNKAAELLEKYSDLQVIAAEDEEAAKELKDVLGEFNDGDSEAASCDDDEVDDEEEEDEDEESDDDDEDDEDEVDSVTCTRSKGYWKTHSDQGPAALNEAWLELENGGATELFSTGKSYLHFLSSAGGNNRYIRLAQQYIVAQLNVFAGVEIPSSAQEAWDEAGKLLEENSDSQQIPDGDESTAKDLESTLKKFNSGDLGPSSCSDDEDDDEDDEDDDDDEYDNLTEAMISIITEFYPGADASSPKDITLCDGTSALELKINYNSNQIYLIFNQAGDTYLSKYVKIDDEDLPSAVEDTLEADYDGFKVKKAYRWTGASGEVTYEVEIQKMSTKKTIIFTENGVVICE